MFNLPSIHFHTVNSTMQFFTPFAVILLAALAGTHPIPEPLALPEPEGLSQLIPRQTSCYPYNCAVGFTLGMFTANLE